MIIRTIIFNILFLLIFTNLISAEEENILRIIQNTEDKFRLINDYEVKMSISVSIPALGRIYFWFAFLESTVKFFVNTVPSYTAIS